MRWFAAFLSYAAINLVQFGPVVASPRPGDALQGTIVISGTSDAIDFVSSELEFGYADDPAGTWFLIAQSDQPVRDGTLAVWDTTVITDGEYDLRLRIRLEDGSSLDVVVPGLRVRNYTPIETPVPGSTTTVDTPTPSAVTPSIPLPTSTPFPPNPAALTPFRILSGLGYGALAAIAFLLLLRLYIHLRRNKYD